MPRNIDGLSVIGGERRICCQLETAGGKIGKTLHRVFIGVADFFGHIGAGAAFVKLVFRDAESPFRNQAVGGQRNCIAASARERIVSARLSSSASGTLARFISFVGVTLSLKVSNETYFPMSVSFFEMSGNPEEGKTFSFPREVALS